jgi:hypothetical protein
MDFRATSAISSSVRMQSKKDTKPILKMIHSNWMSIFQLSSILIGGVRAYGVGTSRNAQGGENKGFQGLMDSRSMSADSSAVRM